MVKCVLCEKTFYTIKELFDMHDDVVCEKCREQFDTTIKQTTVNGVNVYYLFEYSEEMMSALVSLKGLGIREMSDAMILPKLRRKLKKKFKDTIFLYMPSNASDDEERGFRHVETLFYGVSKEGYYPLIKTQKRKQALCSYQERKEIIKYMKPSGEYKVDNKKRIVLVDDVLTSGSTIFSAAKILGISNFEILVLLFNHHNYE